MRQREDDGIGVLVDLVAEERVLQFVIGQPFHRSEEVRYLLTAADFHSPIHQEVWTATLEAGLDGNKGVVTVAGRLADKGLAEAFGDERGRRDLLDRWVAGAYHDGVTQSEQAAMAAASRVLDKAAARAAFKVHDEGRMRLLDGDDPEDVAMATVEGLQAVRSGTTLPDGYMTTADARILENPGSEPVIPGLLCRDWRAVIVGFEGTGKTWLTRQITELSAQGLHPFIRGNRFDPIRTLTIDLENPLQAVQEAMDRLHPPVMDEAGTDYDPDRARIWHEPAGVDIRSGSGYRQITAVLRDHQPDLVAIGPAYHMSRKLKGEDDESYVTSVLNTLSDLRMRFGFALLLEHHVPHGGSSEARRELRPFGSSAWLRWPEMGIGLRPVGAEPNTSSTLALERWRGDRLGNANWPVTVSRTKGGCRPWSQDVVNDDRAPE